MIDEYWWEMIIDDDWWFDVDEQYTESIDYNWW
jgi:hypothetical protein